MVGVGTGGMWRCWIGVLEWGKGEVEDSAL